MTPNDIIGPRPSRLWSALSTVALLLVVAATLMPIFYFMAYHRLLLSPVYKYVYCAGALLLLISKFMTPYRGKSDRVKRLVRLEFWVPIFFGVGAFFLFYNGETRDWIAFTLAGGALMVYTSIMIPVTINRQIKNLDGQ